MALIRSDYMFDVTCPEEVKLKQIEINMIASSFGGSTDKIMKLHQTVLEKENLLSSVELPNNTALNDLARSLVNAWNAFGNDSAVILTIVTEKEQNIFDQRHLENKVFELNSKIKTIRKTLTDVYNHGKLGSENQLIV